LPPAFDIDALSIDSPDRAAKGAFRTEKSIGMDVKSLL
jgi:hypothetical protein